MRVALALARDRVKTVGGLRQVLETVDRLARAGHRHTTSRRPPCRAAWPRDRTLHLRDGRGTRSRTAALHIHTRHGPSTRCTLNGTLVSRAPMISSLPPAP